MFSARFTWDAAAHPLNEALEGQLARGEAIVDLTDANPTRAGLDYPSEAILAALAAPATMRYTPSPRGLAEARQAIADTYRRSGASVPAGRILLTAGTSEAYGLLFKLLADPGDEILIPRPGYPLISHLAGFEGLACHSYPLRHDGQGGWRVDLELLTALVTDRSRAVVLVNPNNPTGNFVREADLAAVDALCRRHAMALIVDEVFGDFTGRPAPDGVRSALNRTTALTFVLNGVSKMLGLPQMKLGWIVAAGHPQWVEPALSHLETLMDFYLTVATPVQVALPGMLAGRFAIQRQIQARIVRNEELLRRRVRETGNMQLVPREGGWYALLFIDDAVDDETRALTLLDRDHTLIHPGRFFEFHREGYVVLSLIPAPDRFATGVDRLIRRYGVPAARRG